MKELQKRIMLILKKGYVIMIIIICIIAFFISNFLYKYVYNTLYNAQIVALFRPYFEIPEIDEQIYKNIESHIAEKNKITEINWNELNNPFMDPIKIIDSNKINEDKSEEE
ncbi:hypothetical protein ACFL23_01305 [Patescibacteria group bacterium]